jgi:hypothetical protein
MENREFDSIIGDSCCPYINSLVDQGTLFTNYRAVAHPSLPNYLAMTSGSTNGKVGTDSITAGELDVENVFHQLSVAGLTWNAFQESMPSACYRGETAGSLPFAYALRHNPAMAYRNVASTSLCNLVVPATGIGLLPNFSFITPNECYNMHSCPPRRGDEWLRANVPALVSAVGPNGRIIITWDEGSTDSGGGNHVATFELGEGVPVGRVFISLDHYSLLAAIEEAFGLSRLQNAAAASPLPFFLSDTG